MFDTILTNAHMYDKLTGIIIFTVLISMLCPGFKNPTAHKNSINWPKISIPVGLFFTSLLTCRLNVEVALS